MVFKILIQLDSLLKAGADKISINTAAVKNPQFIKEASHIFGSQCIVVAVDAKKSQFNEETPDYPIQDVQFTNKSTWEIFTLMVGVIGQE